MQKHLHRAATLPLAAVIALCLASCGGSSSYTQDAAGFEKIGADLASKFGADAWYTDLSVMNDGSGGTILSVTVTDDPSSLKMGEWVMQGGAWRQTSDVTMEIEGGQAADFMFRLGREVDMKRFGTMVEEAKAKVASEKGIEKPDMNLASISLPFEGDKSDMRYYIVVKPKQGGTSFKFHYNAQGELTSFDY